MRRQRSVVMLPLASADSPCPLFFCRVFLVTLLAQLLQQPRLLSRAEEYVLKLPWVEC